MRYIICKEFGWDYITYNNQPQFFLDEISIFLFQENQKNNQEVKKINTNK